MLGLVRIAIVCALGLGSATAAAQSGPPAPMDLPTPDEAAPADPNAPQNPGATGEPEPSAPADAAPPPQAQPPPQPEPAAPPPPEPAPPYEGQVAGDASPIDYEADPGMDDPAPSDGGGSDFPGFSIRLDPLNWLLAGRLGFELEIGVWKFITAELVPVLVVNDEPPSFNFSGRDDPISQHSNGLGPLAGTSIAAGFWPSGEPFSGYVLRLIFTNYGLTYKARDRTGTFDAVDFTERRLVFFFGSYSRFGFFTIGGGLGLGYELNQQQRCFVNRGRSNMRASTSGCPDDGEQHILLDRDGSSIGDLNGVLHPFYIEGRFSLGLAFD